MNKLFSLFIAIYLFPSCALALTSGNCIEFGEIENPWHYIELPSGISDVRWNGSKWVSAISFNIKPTNFQNWLNKCSIVLSEHPQYKQWFIFDSKGVRSITIVQATSNKRVCVEVSENPSSALPENSKHFNGCISELYAYEIANKK